VTLSHPSHRCPPNSYIVYVIMVNTHIDTPDLTHIDGLTQIHALSTDTPLPFEVEARLDSHDMTGEEGCASSVPGV
jgi:hypothetical protein